MGIATAIAQVEVSVGPAVGMNYNMHTGNDVALSTRGYGLVFGGRADLAFSKTLGLLTTIAYDNRIGKFSDSGTDGVIEFSRDASLTVAYVSIEPLFKYTIPDRPVYFVTGPCLGIPVQGKNETTMTILTPGYSFPNGYATQTQNTTIENINTRFEWKIGAGFTYTVDKKTILNFHLVYARGFTDVVKNFNWQVNSLTLLSSFEFTLGR
jgi:hypothetical protein